MRGEYAGSRVDELGVEREGRTTNDEKMDKTKMIKISGAHSISWEFYTNIQDGKGATGSQKLSGEVSISQLRDAVRRKNIELFKP